MVGIAPRQQRGLQTRSRTVVLAPMVAAVGIKGGGGGNGGGGGCALPPPPPLLKVSPWWCRRCHSHAVAHAAAAAAAAAATAGALIPWHPYTDMGSDKEEALHYTDVRNSEHARHLHRGRLPNGPRPGPSRQELRPHRRRLPRAHFLFGRRGGGVVTHRRGRP